MNAKRRIRKKIKNIKSLRDMCDDLDEETHNIIKERISQLEEELRLIEILEGF